MMPSDLVNEKASTGVLPPAEAIDRTLLKGTDLVKHFTPSLRQVRHLTALPSEFDASLLPTARARYGRRLRVVAPSFGANDTLELALRAGRIGDVDFVEHSAMARATFGGDLA